MGFTAIFGFSNLNPILCYVTVNGTMSVSKNNIGYAINYIMQISVIKGSDALLTKSGLLTLNSLPQDIFSTIYDNIKTEIDHNYGTNNASISFTDC